MSSISPIFLASQSQQRKLLLQQFSLPFTIVPSYIDEKKIQAATCDKRVEHIARAKAEKVSKEVQGIIIAGDTFIVHDNTILEKPQDLEEARSMLTRQSGKSFFVYTGFCYIDRENNLNVSQSVCIKATMRTLGKEEIITYTTTQPVLTWAGAFCPAYPAGASLVSSIAGSFTGFTYGLPMEYLAPLLHQSGY